MKILTIGDSWTWGADSSDRHTKSWPAQLAQKYGVEVCNLAAEGGSNKRASRIAIEELSRNPNYDWVIFPLAPAARTEILKKGKWHQIWPNNGSSSEDRLFADFWHPWNDIQEVIITCFYFIHTVKALGIPCYVTGLSLSPSKYQKEISWITDYRDDNDFNRLEMPLSDFNIGIKDLDRKLRSLRALHQRNLAEHPEYLKDVIVDYLDNTEIKQTYQHRRGATGHPDDRGYEALADYFAGKIGLK